VENFSLNSILIEGNVVSAPIVKAEDIVRFSIASTHTSIIRGEAEKRIFTFPIIAVGRLGEICLKNLELGRCVRIVGKLIQTGADEGSSMVELMILAEHLELIPLSQPVRAKAS